MPFSLPLIGKKVDLIDQIKERGERPENGQKAISGSNADQDKGESSSVTFNNYLAAHDVIWGNLGTNPYEPFNESPQKIKCS
jgi:hypothetical protein